MKLLLAKTAYDLSTERVRCAVYTCTNPGSSGYSYAACSDGQYSGKTVYVTNFLLYLPAGT